MNRFNEIVDFYDLLDPEEIAKVDELEKQIDHALVQSDHFSEYNLAK